jgi:hypothetical protein
MHIAFKFPDALKVVDCKERFAASGADILQPSPIVLLFTRAAFEMSQEHLAN